MSTLEQRISECKQSPTHKTRDELIIEYTPFIIKTVSDVTGSYISCENDEEFMVGLEAFNEAIDRYVLGRGSFISFAALVIRSRVTDLLRKDTYYAYNSPLEDYLETEDTRAFYNNKTMEEEVCHIVNVLKRFGIDFDNLVDKAPKHQKTRKEQISLGKKISDDQEIVTELYCKRKLPMASIILKFQTTKKKLKSHRDFIISVIVIFTEKCTLIQSFLNLRGECNV